MDHTHVVVFNKDIKILVTKKQDILYQWIYIPTNINWML